MGAGWIKIKSKIKIKKSGARYSDAWRLLSPRRQQTMPYVNVKMYPGRTDEQKKEVSERIVQALMEVCGVKDRAACAVVVEEVTPEEYAATSIPEIEAKSTQRFA